MDNLFNEVKMSYGRCCVQEAFFDEFYGTFLSTSGEVKNHFQKTDFEKQKKLLREGINFLLMYARGQEFGKLKVTELGKSHSRTGLNISPRLYSVWLESLIKTIKKYDKNFNPALESSWRAALNKGISHMKSLY